MIVELRFRRGTASEWQAVNPILAAGEPGLDLTSNRFKLGDGVAAWNDLPFQSYDLTQLNDLLAAMNDAAVRAETAAQNAEGATSGVNSVAGKTGTVVLTADDITETTTKKILTAAERTSIGTIASKADLVGGVIPTSQLPPLAINEVFTVASQAEMLALNAQRGDMAIRTDSGLTYVLAADAPATLANWKQIAAAGSVVSVAGKTGVVALVKADVGLNLVDNTADASKPVSTSQRTELDKSPVDIFYNSGSGTYPLRNTVTTNTSRRAVWIGPTAPTIGSGYAIDGLDDWDPTS